MNDGIIMTNAPNSCRGALKLEKERPIKGNL